MLFALRPGRTENPFGEWLLGNLPSRVDSRWFSWRAAIFGRYDIFHVHWPEYLFDSGSPFKASVKALLGFALIMRLVIGNIPVVQTVHTQRPYEGVRRLAALQARMLARRTVFRIYLNESDENDYSHGGVVLLGRYEYPIERAINTANDERLLFFGQIREYKGIEELLKAFAGFESESAALVIVGPPINPPYVAKVKALASHDPRVTVDMRRLTNEELVATIDEAALVVLPYRTMYNSSALLLALDRGVPVLAPASPSNLRIQEEVGDRWLQLFDEVLDGATLERAIQSARQVSSAEMIRPSLSRREWSTIGQLHGALYDIVYAVARGNRRVDLRREQVRLRVQRDTQFRSHSKLNASRAKSPDS